MVTDPFSTVHDIISNEDRKFPVNSSTVSKGSVPDSEESSQWEPVERVTGPRTTRVLVDASSSLVSGTHPPLRTRNGWRRSQGGVASGTSRTSLSTPCDSQGSEGDRTEGHEIPDPEWGRRGRSKPWKRPIYLNLRFPSPVFQWRRESVSSR